MTSVFKTQFARKSRRGRGGHFPDSSFQESRELFSISKNEMCQGFPMSIPLFPFSLSIEKLIGAL
jgi:hypothetical protein